MTDKLVNMTCRRGFRPKPLLKGSQHIGSGFGIHKHAVGIVQNRAPEFQFIGDTVYKGTKAHALNYAPDTNVAAFY